ncbi:type IV toxin-antitoxin system AbiEi family antitoxin [Tessaracoccus aquimaris]|uniref:type IV toxin-antitoxin system AbiEi family antitoxin n=1 Tax=Tessaracoccus aquimaris TaxID=1332264 RepID=UPI001314E87B|nr:type IV toxin-antitoxin system AbiEi family antitoxin [Tessaracoccus aquimaris]
MDVPGDRVQSQWLVDYRPGVAVEVTRAEVTRLEEEQHGRVVVVHDYINSHLAARYRAQHISYLDRAGNAFLRTLGLFVYVDGRPRPAGLMTRSTPQTFTKSGVKVVFALLVRSDLTSAPLREIAAAAKVSLGSAHTTLANLDDRGFLAGGVKDRAGLVRMEPLVSEWVAGFVSRLLPSLRSRQFAGPDPRNMRTLAKEIRDVTLAGEVNHPDLIRATSTTIYGLPPWPQITRAGRLRDGESPNVTLRERFWDDSVLHLGVNGHPLLDYAELYSSDEGRQLEVAAAVRRHLLD